MDARVAMVCARSQACGRGGDVDGHGEPILHDSDNRDHGDDRLRRLSNAHDASDASDVSRNRDHRNGG